MKYHEEAGTRVSKFNRLYDDNDVLVGVQILFNGISTQIVISTWLMILC